MLFTNYSALLLLLVCNAGALEPHQCTSHCTLSNKESADCWNQTLKFFEEALLDQLRGYVLAEVGVAAWKSNQNQNIDWKDAAAKTVRRMERLNPPDIEDEIGITDSGVYTSVVQSLIDNAKNVFNKNPKTEFAAPCPVGCEIQHETYKRLFIGSIIGSGVLFVSIIFLSMYTYRRVKKSVKQENVQALQKYENSLTNKSKQTFKLIDVDL